ncbi:NADH-quinone oxidoreductase subunit C [Miltoncostaea marina]|uniref:NADH-quinone oxidoreductase subunit C n=1 Tax=Miltoncostaea marina TaxID=2843215 RepID=UPI001C3C96F2|nr:NADH-quinone oxidoreductase subunit C [Miltoncostaea marina]
MSEVAATIEAAVRGSVTEEVLHAGELTIGVAKERLLEVARFLKGPPLSFALLSDVTCADFPERPGRFRVAYHLLSLASGNRLRLRVWAGADAPEVESVTSVWPTANWHEREVYDLFGVRFRNHPDLTRIMMPLDWEGHPLRRDYPLGGEEVQFTDAV